jgi:hypothetical protein
MQVAERLIVGLPAAGPACNDVIEFVVIEILTW